MNLRKGSERVTKCCHACLQLHQKLSNRLFSLLPNVRETPDPSNRPHTENQQTKTTNDSQRIYKEMERDHERSIRNSTENLWKTTAER